MFSSKRHEIFAVNVKLYLICDFFFNEITQALLQYKHRLAATLLTYLKLYKELQCNSVSIGV